MPDVFKIAELFTASAIARHPDEIDLIGYYGSHAQGTARASSDLDFFYTPADGCAPPVSRTVLIEGTLFDFWPISWDTLAGFATGRTRGWAFAPALVHHTQIMHARSKEAVARLNALKAQVVELQQPAARPLMIQRALDAFPAVLSNWSLLRLAIASADRIDVRDASWRLLGAVCECLALANQTFFHRGFDRLQEQIHTLNRRPDGLSESIQILGTGDDLGLIGQTAEQLVIATRAILRTCETELPVRRTAHDIFAHSYPEFRDGLRKVFDACDRGQPLSASAAAWLVQSDLTQMLRAIERGADAGSNWLQSDRTARQQTPHFAELVGSVDELAAQARLLDAQMRSWLRDQGIPLREYDSAEQFAAGL